MYSITSEGLAALIDRLAALRQGANVTVRAGELQRIALELRERRTRGLSGTSPATMIRICVVLAILLILALVTADLTLLVWALMMIVTLTAAILGFVVGFDRGVAESKELAGEAAGEVLSEALEDVRQRIRAAGINPPERANKGEI
jgi:ABC-type bacteriocin/lantibiotic exporter with double-glycine peptidase domain